MGMDIIIRALRASLAASAISLVFLGGCSDNGNQSAGSGQKTQISTIGTKPETTATKSREWTTAARPRTETDDNQLSGPALVVSGQITTHDGKPVEGARIIQRGHAFDGLRITDYTVRAETKSNPDGTYKLVGSEDGNSMIPIIASGNFSPLRINISPDRDPFRKSVRRLERNFVVPVCHELTGTLYNDKNEPLAGASISIQPWSSDDKTEDVRSDEPIITTSTATGEFRFPYLAEGKWLLGVKAPDFAVVSMPVDMPHGSPLKIKLTDRGGTIRGIVYQKTDGTPVSGLKIYLNHEGSNRPYGLEREQRVTDADGAFRFDHVTTLPVSLDLSYQESEQRKLALLPPYPDKIILQEGQTTDVLLFTYPGVTITGQVFDKDTSEPLAGATVMKDGDNSSDSVLTDAQGRYELRNQFLSRIPGWIKLKAEHDGYLAVGAPGQDGIESVRVPEDYSSALTKDIPMMHVVNISGKVVTRDEMPLPTARVLFVTPANFYRQRKEKGFPVNPDGSFTLQVKPFDKGVVYAQASGFAPGNSPLIDLTDEDVDSVNVVMDPGVTVQGTVVDPDGKPVPEATINTVTTFKDVPNMSQYTHLSQDNVSDGHGRFTLTYLPAKFNLYASHKKFASSELEKLELQPGDLRSDMKLTLRSSLTISGKVLWGSNRQPAKDVQLYTMGNSTAYSSATTTASGEFILDRLIDSEYSIYVSSGNNYKQFPNVKAGTSNLEILLDGGTSETVKIRGLVVDAATNQPIKDFVLKDEPSYKKLAQPGMFEWEVARNGGTQMRYVAAEGYADELVTFDTNVDSEVLTQTIKLGKNGAITGRVIDGKTKQPVPNVSVVNWGKQNESYMTNKTPKTYTTTDAEGRFVLAPAPYGTNRIAVKPKPPAIELNRTAEVGSEETVDMGDIELSLGGTVQGRVVVSHDNSPVPDKEVSISGWQNNQSFDRKVKTDAEGKFEFTGIPPSDNFILTCESTMKNVRITGDETVEVELKIGHVTVSGKVTRGGQPVSIRLDARGPDDQTISANSANGEYKISGVVPGAYLFTVGDVKEEVKVPDVAEFKKDFELPDGGMTVMVTDSTGKPVTGAQVTINQKESPTGVERSWEIRSKKESTRFDGTAEFKGLTPAVYNVVAAKTGMGSAVEADVKVEAGVRKEVALQLKGGGGTLVSVALKSSDGSPHTNAWCYLYGPDGLFTHVARRDANGVMTIPNLPPGTYRTNVSYWSYSQSEREVEIKAGETATIEDVLYGAGSIQWQLKKADGSGAAYAKVTVTPLQTDPVDHERTGLADSFGNFEDRGLAPGTYQVTAELSGKSPVSEVFEVKAASHTAKEKVVNTW